MPNCPECCLIAMSILFPTQPVMAESRDTVRKTLR
jgi:hypothetical protein